MRKTVRIIGTIFSVALFCLPLCGCDALDALRERHAYIDESGDIIYNGQRYVLAPDYVRDETYYGANYGFYLNVTDEDVPVLLSESLGTPAWLNDETCIFYEYQYYCIE